MKISTSLVPELVWYKCYSDCTITEALLHAFRDAENNTLTLPDIWRIKVNNNRLLGSYGHSIMELRRKWYDIKTYVTHDKNHITTSQYTLENPDFSPSDSEQFNNI